MDPFERENKPVMFPDSAKTDDDSFYIAQGTVPRVDLNDPKREKYSDKYTLKKKRFTRSFLILLRMIGASL